MTNEELLRGVDVFLFDLDGTLYLGERPIGDSPRTLARLRAMGKRVVFLTNNSSKTEKEYREKLTRLALWGETDLVYTSAMATAALLKRNYAGARVYLSATDAVKEEFAAAGVHLTEDSPDVCVLAYDTQITFEKIVKFNSFLRKGVVFLATHPDDVCPAEDVPVPDVGSFLALFSRASGRTPDVIVGKPYQTMGKELSRLLGVKRERLCMAGDRLSTDILFGKNNGMKTLLVLSGESTEEDAERAPFRPDLVLADVNKLVSSV